MTQQRATCSGSGIAWQPHSTSNGKALLQACKILPEKHPEPCEFRRFFSSNKRANPVHKKPPSFCTTAAMAKPCILQHFLSQNITIPAPFPPSDSKIFARARCEPLPHRSGRACKQHRQRQGCATGCTFRCNNQHRPGEKTHPCPSKGRSALAQGLLGSLTEPATARPCCRHAKSC